MDNLESASILTRYGYTMFKETDKAQYWKSNVGTIATLYTGGGWQHSGGDTVRGLMPQDLADRLLKYHHKIVPSEGFEA